MGCNPEGAATMALSRNQFEPKYYGVFEAFDALKNAVAGVQSKPTEWAQLIGSWGVFAPRCFRGTNPNRGQIDQFASRVRALVAVTNGSDEFSKAGRELASALEAAVIVL